MKTIEGNILISAFMNDTTIEKDVFLSRSREELKYHSSWDWLMPVISKITRICNTDDKDDLFYSDEFDSLRNNLPIADIEYCHKVTVSWIEMYNKQK